MASRRYGIDMSRGSIFQNIILFAVPLILTNILQLLYNAADLVVVSRWAGNDAMAAVGATGSLSALITNIFMGISLGASVLVSRSYGSGDAQGVHRAVHTSVMIGMIAGGCSFIAGEIFSKPLLVLMGTPEGTVLDGAALYMRIIFLGTPASMVYNFGAAIMRAIGDTRRPLYILASTGILNVLLNLVLVIGFDLGVAGVAIATISANYVSMLAVMYYLIRSDGTYRLNLKKLHLYKKETKDILKIGLPAGVQSSVFSLSNMAIQSAVNSFGTAAIAGSAAGGNIEGFVYTSMNAFYQATITAVSQNYGAKNEKRIYKSILVATACVSVVGLVLGILSAVFARPLLSIYITDSPEAMAFGIMRMIVTGTPYFLCGIMEVLTGALRGLGYSTATAIFSLIGICGIRIVWIFTVLPLRKTVEVLFLCWPISWFIVIVMYLVCFFVVRKRAIRRMYGDE